MSDAQPLVTLAPDATGAEVFAAVQRVLRPQRTGETSFTATSLPHINERIYGGQVFAQCVNAASTTVLPERAAHSVHGYFLRPGRLEVPIDIEVEVLHDGRSFSARRAHARQEGEQIASLTVSFQVPQPGLEHAERAVHHVPDPEELTSSNVILGALPGYARRALTPECAFDVRHVEPQIYTRTDRARPFSQSLWIRAHGALDGLEDRNQRAALLLYASDQVMLEPAMRGHGLSWATPGLSIASIDHAMWWHRDVDVTAWHLFVQGSRASQGGRALADCRVYDREGVLVASVAQEGVLRVRGEAPGR